MFDMSLRRNRCFCSEGRDWKDCDGWSDMSACLFGAPAGISFPHFLYTPRRLAEVDGLNPDPEKHFGFLEFETNLAAPGILRLCLQGVLDISPVPSVAALSGLPTVKLPVFWVKLYAGADTPVLGTLFFVGANFLRYGSIIFLFGGLGLSALFLKQGMSYKKRQQVLLNST
uniref:Sensory neuron membrane protein n=1 Tax=Tyrophagus putrescentiae TaxID=59818 RepID=A0A3S6QAF4_TYRPU|nr:sensory neuron membrane protein [Tyrophagus putrescentiae]